MHRQLPSTAAALFALTACSPTAQADSEAEQSLQQPPEWTVAEAPVSSIGGESLRLDADLYGIRGLVKLSDGRIVVADGSQRLLFFDAAGRHLQSVGQRGNGPGEFHAITWIQRLPGDTVLVWDLQNARRLSYISSDGVFARSVVPSSPLRLIGALADGSLIAVKASGYLKPFASARDDEVAWARPEVELLRLDEEGRLLDSLGTFPGTEEVSLPASGMGRFPMTVVDERSPLFTTLVVPGADRVFVTTGEQFEVRVLSMEGGHLEAVIRQEFDLAPVTEEYLTDFFLAFMSGYAIRDRVQWDALQWKVPDERSLPAITDLRLDEDRNLWIGEHRSHSDPSRTWHVYSRTGSYLARAIMPADFQPFIIEAETVLGVWRDDLDVEHVQMRRITRD